MRSCCGKWGRSRPGPVPTSQASEAHTTWAVAGWPKIRQHGVVDRELQVHDTPGLYVFSGAVFPTCPGINPTLTLWALVCLGGRSTEGTDADGVNEWQSPDDRILMHVDGHIATVTIARPEKLNAIAPEMLEALRQTFRVLDRDNDVRVILLTATGGRAFSVGADITAWSALTPLDMWRLWVREGHAAIDVIAGVRQPTIAVIDGLALGGGLELALACDLRICTDRSRFGSPEVKIATLPGWGGTRRLVETVGLARTKQLVFTGDQIDADTALSLGIGQRGGCASTV